MPTYSVTKVYIYCCTTSLLGLAGCHKRMNHIYTQHGYLPYLINHNLPDATIASHEYNDFLNLLPYMMSSDPSVPETRVLAVASHVGTTDPIVP